MDTNLLIIVPAVVIGIALGPIAAKFLQSEKWGNAEPGQTNAITLVCFSSLVLPGIMITELTAL